MCISYIRRYVFQLKKWQLFTTRDCLLYGSRSAVDQALFRLVKKGVLIRLTRGVFARNDYDHHQYSVAEVAATKAMSFGRTITRHAAQTAAELKLCTPPGYTNVFCINASSSKFHYGDTVVHLKGTCPRKMRPSITKAAKAIRALWYLGKDNCDFTHIEAALTDFLRQDRQELRWSSALMPSWLSDRFAARSINPKEPPVMMFSGECHPGKLSRDGSYDTIHIGARLALIDKFMLLG
jgi:hypothetical protein